MNPAESDDYAEWVRLSTTLRTLARQLDQDLDRGDRVRFSWHAKTWAYTRRKLAELWP